MPRKVGRPRHEPKHPTGRLGGVYALEDDHPLMLAMRRDDDAIIAVAYDDVYLMVIRKGENGEKEAVRHVPSSELRAALDAYERGEPVELGRYELRPHRLKMDETEE